MIHLSSRMTGLAVFVMAACVSYGCSNGDVIENNPFGPDAQNSAYDDAGNLIPDDPDTIDDAGEEVTPADDSGGTGENPEEPADESEVPAQPVDDFSDAENIETDGAEDTVPPVQADPEQETEQPPTESEIIVPDTDEAEVLQIIRALEDSTSAKPVSLDGKTIGIVGNSQIYYGSYVIKGSQGQKDYGYLYQLARNNGENITVYDWCYGGKTISWITDKLKAQDQKQFKNYDWVIVSEAGQNTKDFVKVMEKLMAIFPNARFIYMNHEFSVYKNHTNILNSFGTLQKKGVLIANVGQLLFNMWNHKSDWKPAKTVVDYANYKRWTFVKNNSGYTNGSGSVGAGADGDQHHPNPLNGYIGAVMTYTAMTEKTAVGQPYTFAYDYKQYSDSIQKYFNIDAFYKAHYNGKVSSNFREIMKNGDTILSIQALVDKMNANYGIVPAMGKACEHQFGNVTSNLPATSNTYGVGTSHCAVCDNDIHVEFSSSSPARRNVMLVTPDELKAQGVETVKQYMVDAKAGNVFYQTEAGWGRRGYSSIQGMASMCDGNRHSEKTTDGSQLYWKIKDQAVKYHADGSTSDNANYVSLIGYRFNSPVKVNGFALFNDATVGALTGFDILGGIKKADSDDYTWKVLWSGSNLNSKYSTYDEKTRYLASDFDEISIDAVQIGVTGASGSVLYMSELELYGE